MNGLLSLSWRNLWRQKRRTWLTVSAMIFSNILLVFMITLQLGNYDMMIENSLKAYSVQIQISRSGYSNDPKLRRVIRAPDALAETIRDTLPELSVTVRGEGFVLASSAERSFGVQIAGVDPEYEPRVSSIFGLIKRGGHLEESAQNELIIGAALARNLKVDVGDELTLLGSGLDGSFAAAVATVAGIYESGMTDIDRNLALMSLRGFKELFSMSDNAHTIIINSPSIAEVDQYQAQLRQLIDAHHATHGAELDVLNWRELNPGLQQAILSDLVSAWIMYGVLVVLVAFGVLNTQLMSVLERTREFGIMTAIGLRSSMLSKMVLLETVIMAALGLIIGAAGGLILAAWLNHTGVTFPGMEDMAKQYNLPDTMHPAISPVSILTGPLTVFAGSVIAAIYPMLKLRTLQPVSAMRAAQ